LAKAADFGGRPKGSARVKSSILFKELEGGWAEARLQATGYGTAKIADAVKEASLRVRDGESVHERDGVNFSTIEYCWPVLSGLLLAASGQNGELRVIDFGGSLGTTYFQNRKYFDELRSVKWGIVEQPSFSKIGRAEFANEELSFHLQFELACEEVRPSVIHFGSSLQYVEDPRLLLASAAASGAKHLILDRTPLHAGPRDILTVQTVPESIYEGEYPAWIFSKDLLFHDLSKQWNLLEVFNSVGSRSRTDLGTTFEWEGAHFLRQGG
jgi:putative methyltransferase (TIGR04325 family)